MPDLGTAVPSCHAGALGVAASPDAPVVALVGAPNVGKSTLFNTLTGARRDVGNWPGTTVEVGRGSWRSGGAEIAVLDLPGAVSLDPLSPDEELTRVLLLDGPAPERPDAVVLVVDGAQLARCLYLLAQLRETSYRLVLAVAMTDVAGRRGVHLDVAGLTAATGVSAVVVDPRTGWGREDLVAAVRRVLVEPAPQPRTVDPAAADDPLATEDDRFVWMDQVLAVAVRRSGPPSVTWSDRVDRVVTAPVLGLLVFLAVMWGVFQVTTVVAAPLQGGLDTLVSGPVTALTTAVLEALGLGGGLLAGFLVEGLVVGVGMLLTFLPLMALMFVLLAVLEASGYLARAAVVTDRVMRAIGLPGRAFLPLVVGFGCNVPAISAVRVLPDARHRLLTALLVPFTACSARLAVFVLVGTTFFGAQAGNVVFGMYVTSLALVVLVGLLLRSTLWRTVGTEPLLIDLPPYQLPHPRQVASVTWVRVRAFLRTAGGIIVVTVAAVWLLSALPAPGSGAHVGAVPIERSVYAAAAQAAAPVFAPAGFGDWHATGALVTGFVAKEAVIASWAQTYAAQEPAAPTEPGELGALLREDFAASSGGHPVAAVFAFLVFVLAYTPCVATLATQLREIGRRWTLVSLGLSLGVAYVLAVAVFQVGRLLG